MQLPGMLYAAVLYPDVQHEKPEQVDDAAAESRQGRGQDRAAAGRRRRHRRHRRRRDARQGRAQGHLDQGGARADLHRRRRPRRLPHHRRRLDQARHRDGEEGRCRRRAQGRRQGDDGGVFLRARLPCLHGAAERHRAGRRRQGRGLVGQSGAGRHADPGVDRAPAPRRTRSACTRSCWAAASAAVRTATTCSTPPCWPRPSPGVR